jgi:hypothetical protein
MIVNSSELCAAGFYLREVLPLQLEEAARGGQRTRGATLKQIHGMGNGRYVLSVDKVITTMTSGHDVSEYELGASGLPRAYVSPQATTVEKLIKNREKSLFLQKKKNLGVVR